MSEYILGLIAAAEESLTLEETHSFHNRLLGALAASFTDPEVWRRAIGAATTSTSAEVTAERIVCREPIPLWVEIEFGELDAPAHCILEAGHLGPHYSN